MRSRIAANKFRVTATSASWNVTYLRMPSNLRTDLDELLPQCRQRPLADALGNRQPPQEVGQVVGQGEQLRADLVVLERPAGKRRPLDGILTLLDPLFCSAGLAKAASPRKNLGMVKWRYRSITGKSTRRQNFALA